MVLAPGRAVPGKTMEPLATALLVDDDPHTVDVLRTALVGEPVAFDVAYDLATAISCLDSGRYSGVIVDLALPQGNDVLRHMSSRNMTVPTVVIASEVAPQPLIARENVKMLLPKRVETAILLNVIRGLCGLSSGNA